MGNEIYNNCTYALSMTPDTDKYIWPGFKFLGSTLLKASS